MGEKRVNDFDPFDSVTKCLIGSLIFSVGPYLLFNFPHYGFNRNLAICVGVFLFFAAQAFYIFYSYGYDAEHGKGLSIGVIRSWPWNLIVYPFFVDTTFKETRRIPSYGIPLFVSTKAFVIWFILFSIYYEVDRMTVSLAHDIDRFFDVSFNSGFEGELHDYIEQNSIDSQVPWDNL